MSKPFDPRDLPGVHFKDVRRVEIKNPDGSTRVVHRGLVKPEDLPPPRTNEDAAESEASPPVRED